MIIQLNPFKYNIKICFSNRSKYQIKFQIFLIHHFIFLSLKNLISIKGKILSIINLYRTRMFPGVKKWPRRSSHMRCNFFIYTIYIHYIL